MKKTIEFLKKNGIVDRIQKAVDFAPKNLVEKDDPNVKDFQKHVLMNSIVNLGEEKEEEFFKATIDDLIYALNIKKNNKEGDKVASLLVEIIKELEK